MRADFEELYIFARRLGLQVLLFTNGRLITPHLADLLARIPPLVEIEITVYGMHAESYEAVTRRPGSFAQFRRGVNLLLERDVPFAVKSALLPPNKHEIDEFEAWAKTIPGMWTYKRPNYALFFDLRQRRDDTEKNALIESHRLSRGWRCWHATKQAIAGGWLSSHRNSWDRWATNCSVAAPGTASAWMRMGAPNRVWACARRS